MSKLFKAQQGQLLPYYWFNGKIYHRLRDGGPTVPTFSQAMDYSVLVFEGMRVNWDGKRTFSGFRLQDHLKRLLKSWEGMGRKCPFSFDELFKGLKDFIEMNLALLKNEQPQSLYIRPKIFDSEGVIKPMAGHTHEVVIEGFPLANYQPKGGISATVADFVRTYRYSGYTVKGAGKYAEYGMLRDSRKDEYQEVLQLGLGHGGKLIFTEGTTSNLFLVKNGRLFTPGEEDFLLHGITRDTVIQLAKYLGIRVVDGDVPLSMILECDEVFLTGTASFITPVISFGRLQLDVGPLTKKLSKIFAKVRQRKIKKFSHWLTPFKI